MSNLRLDFNSDPIQDSELKLYTGGNSMVCNGNLDPGNRSPGFI